MKVEYRGVATHINIQSIDEEIEVRVWSFLKGAAVAHKLLPPILCEDELCTIANYIAPEKFQVDAALFAGAARMRQAANALLDQEAAEDGEAVKAGDCEQQTAHAHRCTRQICSFWSFVVLIIFVFLFGGCMCGAEGCFVARRLCLQRSPRCS